MKQVESKNVYTYVLLSLAFIIANLVTQSNLAPWIDEVMMLDTSYNAAFHGRWETTAWYRVVGEYPFSTYPPLYQMTAAVWMWLFGGNIVAAVLVFHLWSTASIFLLYITISITLFRMTFLLFNTLFGATSQKFHHFFGSS